MKFRSPSRLPAPLLAVACAAFVSFAAAQSGSGGGGGGASSGSEESPLAVESGEDGWFRWNGRHDTGYRVRLDAVQSYGIQRYEIPEANVRVTELTIDSSGSVAARFYYIENLAAEQSGAGAALERGLQRAGELTERATGTNLADLVIKTYPDTTHSHTMEYRLRSAAEVAGLENALSQAIAENRGAVVSPEAR